jgi:hypothetical protein
MVGVVVQPWWVNLAILVPPAAYWSWRNGGVAIGARQLAVAGVFAVAFGFVEASVVVYLRAASGLLPGYQGTLSDVMRLSGIYYQQAQAVKELPKSLITIEALREAATLFMLVSVAVLCVRRARSRWAIFLWMFAIWDIVYYVALWSTVRWPRSLKELDVLFLLPVPWIAPVWFPVLVSALAMLAVLLRRTAVAES